MFKFEVFFESSRETISLGKIRGEIRPLRQSDGADVFSSEEGEVFFFGC